MEIYKSPYAPVYGSADSEVYKAYGYINPRTGQRVSLDTYIRDNAKVNKEDYVKFKDLAQSYFVNNRSNFISKINTFLGELGNAGLANVADIVAEWKYGMLNPYLPGRPAIFSHTV